MRHALDEGIEAIKKLFADPDRRAVHERARAILAGLAADPGVREEIIRRNMSAPGFFSRVRNNPALGFGIHEDKSFTLLANIWPPHPSRTTELSHQSIHHHGKLLLTSASAFGEGYESILFKRGFEVDAQTGATRMEIDKHYRNSRGNIEFVDSFAPHVVFYPRSLSITFVLWSSEEAAAVESLKSIGFLKKHKATLKKALNATGLAGVLGLNKIENFDFYADQGVIRQLKARIQYSGGTSENFARNVGYLLQQTGFDDGDFLKRLHAGLSGRELEVAGPWLEAVLKGKPIEDSFEPEHLHIPTVTLDKNQVLACFPRLGGAATKLVQRE